MSDGFVVRNQLGHFWGKKKRWVDGSKPARVMTLKHQDEGLNLLVELSSRDVDLRGDVIPVSTNARGIPQVEPSEHRLQDEDDLAAALAESDSEDGKEGETDAAAGETATKA